MVSLARVSLVRVSLATVSVAMVSLATVSLAHLMPHDSEQVVDQARRIDRHEHWLLDVELHTEYPPQGAVVRELEWAQQRALALLQLNVTVVRGGGELAHLPR